MNRSKSKVNLLHSILIPGFCGFTLLLLQDLLVTYLGGLKHLGPQMDGLTLIWNKNPLMANFAIYGLFCHIWTFLPFMNFFAIYGFLLSHIAKMSIYGKKYIYGTKIPYMASFILIW